MYFLAFFLFSLPFVFSHLFWAWFFVYIQSFLWENFHIFLASISFEKIKVLYLFCFLVCFLVFLVWKYIFSYKYSRKKSFFSLYFLWGYCILLAIPLVSYLLFWWDASYFLWGNSQKMHGYIWYIACALFWSISALYFQKKLLFYRAILLASCFVWGLTLGEFFLGSSLWFWDSLTIPWWEFRPIISFWNPNYIAGFLLLTLPVILSYCKQKYIKIPLFVLVLWAIVSTGSLTALVLSLGFIFFEISRIFRIDMRILILIFACSAAALFALLPREKILSFESRIALQEDIISDISFPEILVWKWIGSIEEHFRETRNQKIQKYFPNHFIIDSSHNIFVDFLYEFGIIWLGIFLLYFWYFWKCFEYGEKIICILFFLFFSFNTLTTLPVLIFLWASAYGFWQSSRHNWSTRTSSCSQNEVQRNTLWRNSKNRA